MLFRSVSNSDTLFYEFKSSLNQYLKHANYPAANSLHDIIEFNKTNQERLLKYGQTLLEQSEATSGDLDDPKYINLRKSLLEKASIFDALMDTHQLDALVSTHWLPESPIFGQPSLVYPMTRTFNKPIKSLVFIGKKHQEKVLLQIGYLLEQKEKEA